MSLDKVVSLLQNLAFELQALIIGNLKWRDILHLRMTSKAFLNFVHAHAGEISRNLIRHDSALSVVHSLFNDIAAPPKPTLDYVFALARRSSIVEHLAWMLATHQLTQVSYARPGTASAMERLARQHTLVAKNLRPHLLIIAHMLETYRSFMAELLQDNDLLGDQDPLLSKVEIWNAEFEILEQYNETEICRTSMVFELLKRVLGRQLRPASYAGYVERHLRGWTKPSGSDEQVLSLMIFGGLEAVHRVMSLPTYNGRIEALEDELNQSTSGSPSGKSQLPVPGTMPRASRSLVDPLDSVTAERIKAVAFAPPRERFFDVWEMERLLLSKAITSNIPSQACEYLAPQDFLKLLRSDEMDSNFELRPRTCGAGLGYKSLCDHYRDIRRSVH